MNASIVAQFVLEFEKAYLSDTDEGKRFQESRLKLLLSLSIGQNNEFIKIVGEHYSKEAKMAAEIILERIKETKMSSIS